MRKVRPRHYESSRGDMYVRRSGYGLCHGNRKFHPYQGDTTSDFYSKQRPFFQTTKVKGWRASQCHINVAEICEAINAKMTPLFNCDVHSLIDLQKRSETFLPQWETITTDPAIRQFVARVTREF